MTRSHNLFRSGIFILLGMWGISFSAGAPPIKVAASKTAARRNAIPQVEQINAQLAASWSTSNVAPSRPAADGIWCRRVYLDLLGRIPTEQELRAYLAERGSDRQRRLVERLLTDEDYQEEFAENWGTLWTNLLIGRGDANADQTFTNRAGLMEYCRSVFREGRPYDQFVKELIAAEGSTRPGAAGFNGATNYLVMKLADGGVQATSHTSQLFLGVRIQCTQCHDHPFHDWKQNRFWELNSFFRQTVALRRFVEGTDDIDFVELTDQDYPGPSGTLEQAEVFYELRNGQLKSAYPHFIDGTSIDPHGLIEKVHRRRELARLVIESPNLAEAIVNRLWAHFLGRGFTKPVDDMGPHNQVSHPEVLQYLAQQLREHRYDLRSLMTWITLSDAYVTSSNVAKGNASDDPLAGSSPLFSRFYVRQMRPEDLYRSLLVATRADRAWRTSAAQYEAQRRWLEQFTLAFGTDEGDESTTFDGTIPQTLMMFNGELMKQATSGESETFLGEIIASGERWNDKVKRLYFVALARTPTRPEQKMAQELLGAQQNDQTLALQDLWWALLNSNEFVLNH